MITPKLPCTTASETYPSPIGLPTDSRDEAFSESLVLPQEIIVTVTTGAKQNTRENASKPRLGMRHSLWI